MSQRGLKRTLTDFLRHPWLHIVSMATIAVSLSLLGLYLLCYRNFDDLAERTSARSTGTVYLKEALTEADVDRLKSRINSLSPVQHIAFKNRHSIMDELQTFLGVSPSEPLSGADLFPDVLELEMRREVTTSQLSELKAIVSKMPEVSEVDFSEDWLVQVKKIRRYLSVFGLVFMAGVVIGCGFIIANFMGMRHQSRKAEIEIIRLHGAHSHFILAPFLWEGIIEGIAGAFLALVSLYALKTVINFLVPAQWTSLIGMREWLYLSTGQCILVITLGIAMALIGSFAVFMRFQQSAPR